MRALYRVTLGREPDPEGLAFHVEGLRERGMRRLQLLDAFMESGEFRQRHGLVPAHPPHLDALHHARRMLVRDHLPYAETVIDLGGASSTYEGGALLEMGY
ncbi:MAG TPA: DUF4214 domain-containing protein, partial [Chloroflexota bacterium]